MAITNAQKQARFRKKQELKKFKDLVFKEWQLGIGFHPRRETPGEILALLDEAASLPSGWNEEDFERAVHRISQLRFDFVDKQDDLKKDVEEGAGISEKFLHTPDPDKLISDTRKSVSKTRALASHLISALKLSTLSNSELAAAVMEAVRYVGRAAANSDDMAKSGAMMVCQASLPSYYGRPGWFLDSLIIWLANHCDEELFHELGERLSSFQQDDML